MTRRQFAFWLGFGLFSLSDKLRISGLDHFAAAAMRKTQATPGSGAASTVAEHWTVADDETWTWFERENQIDGQWVLTGATTPINKETGEAKSEVGGYLDDSLVPAEMRRDHQGKSSQFAGDTPLARASRLPNAKLRGRHGRPPSEWLRSLNADELRIWLGTIDVPEAGVSGMSYWDHLTGDHSFDPVKIEGLIEAEQAKLHAAAHFGY